MAKNVHKVPKRQWRKWGKLGQRVFNRLYGQMARSPEHFRHPDAVPVARAHWRTTAWNAAFIAACEATAET